MYNNNINGRPETLPEESSDDNEDDRKVYSKANRPMSPTTEVCIIIIHAIINLTM